MRKVAFLFITVLTLLLVSCGNLFGDDEPEAQSSVTFYGNFSVNKDYAGFVREAAEDTNASRSAMPTLPSSLTYYAKATTAGQDDIESNDVNQTNGTFSIPLKPGHTWTIEVGAKGQSAINASATDAVLLKDTFEYEATDASPSVNHDFDLKPLITSTGHGKLDLTITVEKPYSNKIASVEISPTLYSYDSLSGKWNPDESLTVSTVWSSVLGSGSAKTFNSTSTPAFATSDTVNTIHLQSDNFPSSISDVYIHFKDNSGQNVFTTRQTVAVYDNLETSTWHTSSETSNTLINNETGTLYLTKALLDAYRYTDFYVDGNYDDSEHAGTGRINTPYKTIKEAVTLINAINDSSLGKTYTIHVKDGTNNTLPSTNGNQIYISSNIYLECYKDNPGDEMGKATLSAPSGNVLNISATNITFTLAGKQTGSYNSSSLDFTGLTIHSTSSALSPVSAHRAVYVDSTCTFIMNGGSIENFNSQINSGVYVNTNACFIMNGGFIKNNSSPYSGAGVWGSNNSEIIMRGGKITGNHCTDATKDGAGIYVRGIFAVSGTPDVSGNYRGTSTENRSNIYLPSGKKIRVDGSLGDSTTYANLWVGTEDKPVPSLYNPTNTGSKAITITEGYGFGKAWGSNRSGAAWFAPDKFFHSDEGYAIISTPVIGSQSTILDGNGEVLIEVSGGYLKDKYTDPITLECANSFADLGTEKTFTFSAKNDLGNVITEGITYTLGGVYMNGSSVPSTYYTWSATTDPNKVTIKNNLPVAGKYTIVMKALYKGTTYTKTQNVSVYQLVSVPGGSFTGSATLCAGDTDRVSSVFINGRTNLSNMKNLIASDHEVTQAEYETYCRYSDTSYVPSSTYGLGDDYPVYYVNWYDAIVYCNLKTINDPNLGLSHCVYSKGGDKNPANWSGRQYTTANGVTKFCGPNTIPAIYTSWDNGIVFDQNADGWRLPTEAEWEYLARGGNLTDGNQTIYSGSDTIDNVAWYSDNCAVNGTQKAHEVRTKYPNALGLYDMTGNVDEWCWDKHNSIGTDTPADGPTSCPSVFGVVAYSRVKRGGSWYHTAPYCTVSYHYYFSPDSRLSYLGFRVVRNAD